MKKFDFDYIKKEFPLSNIKTIKIIEDFEIAVDSNGNVFTPTNYTKRKNGRPFNRKGRLIKPTIDEYGYYRCTFSYKLKRKSFYSHRLIAKAFLKNYSENLQVNHINGNKLDNRVENLEMCTLQENIRHSIENNLKPKLLRDKKGRFIGKEVI